MSGKGRVRRTRRTNTHDEDHQETKHDETIDQSDDNKSTMSNDTDKLDTSLKEEANGHDTSTSEINIKDTEKTPSSSPTITTTTKPDETSIIEKTNGQSEEITDLLTQPPTDKPEPIKNGDEQSSGEVESINVDSEDPELQFTSEQNSDKSSEVESSPTLNRCRTRRSHTRNLPTPKTPKIFDTTNGDVDEVESKAEKIETNTETPDAVITIAEDIEENSENVSLASNISIDGSVEEKTLDGDLVNASTYVNLGNDTTKNFDITVQSNVEEENITSSFLETTKDKSYGETLRCLTGRKTSRNYHAPSRMYSSTIELNTRDFTDSSKKYTPGGVKRKLEVESPSDKRMRTEDVSPGILSYLTSPFKNKIARNDVPSSTPKLTSFKYVHSGSTVIDEVSKVDLEGEDKPTEPRKWCSIM